MRQRSRVPATRDRRKQQLLSVMPAKRVDGECHECKGPRSLAAVIGRKDSWVVTFDHVEGCTVLRQHRAMLRKMGAVG